ncbi:hypothetical protein ACQ4N7_25000 [Nodosilinea sp. AN01ver1]
MPSGCANTSFQSFPWFGVSRSIPGTCCAYCHFGNYFKAERCDLAQQSIWQREP